MDQKNKISEPKQEKTGMSMTGQHGHSEPAVTHSGKSQQKTPAAPKTPKK